MSHVIGWWIVPAVITITAAALAQNEHIRAKEAENFYARRAAPTVAIIAWLFAGFISAVAWLVWALVA